MLSNVLNLACPKKASYLKLSPIIVMEDILKKIQLPETVTDALLSRQGIYGPFLELTEACEQDDSEKIKELAGLLQFDAKKVNASHIAALAWVEEMQEAL